MIRTRVRFVATGVVSLLLIAAMAPVSKGYSVLSHEAIIDSTWDSDIKPLLLKRFPNTTPEQLRVAHAHAYGGAIIQDMGYYPFGSKFFSDLTHYVRSGDFVEALLRDAQDVNDYAFALGALCHYSADNIGHPVAVNRSVAILYPKLRRRYGASVTYEQNPSAHIRTEFGFDVVEVANRHFASEDYHDFIGFEVSQNLLERAFKETYGVDLKSIFTSLDLSLGTFRFSVSTVIPKMTEVAWQTHKDEIQKERPGMTRKVFLYKLSRASYQKEWGNKYRGPGFFARLLAAVFRVVPKFGPFSALEIKPSNPETDKLFMQSFNETVDNYRRLLAQAQAGSLDLSNKNFDTGKPTADGEYMLADRAYSELLAKLAAKHFADVSPELQTNIISFFSDVRPESTSTKDQSKARAIRQELGQLKAFKATGGANTTR